MTAIKLFGTDGIRGKAGASPLTEDAVARLANAFGQYLHENKRPGISSYALTVVVGRDTRPSSPMLENAVVQGIQQAGIDALLLGVLPTNAVAHLTRHYRANGAVMITASHNPAEDNGIKFLDSNGCKLHESEEKKIEELFFSNKPAYAAGTKGKITQAATAAQDYMCFLQGTIQGTSLSELSLVVDCGNGAASTVAYEVFSRAGVKAKLLNAEPNGTNINLNCGAMHPKGMAEAVVKYRANAGVALDGDADRAVFCDETGKILNGDHIMAVIASSLHGQGRLAHSTLVATNYSNLALDGAMKEQGIAVARVENGDKYVFEEMEKHYYSFGGEQSGHFIFGEFAKTGDGMLTALQLLSIMKQTGKPLSQLSSVLQPYPQTFVNVPVNSKIPLQETRWVSAAIAEAERSLNGTGRVFVRYSGTEPVLRIMVESRDGKEIKGLAERIAAAAKKEIGA